MTSRQRRKLFTLAVVAIVIGLYLYRQSQLASRHGLPSNGIACGAPCGVERWPVKTLTDSDAASVNFSPRPTTVAWLIAQPAPSTLAEDSRVAPLELQTFTVRAQLIAIKEEDDRDFHILLAGVNDPSATMIAEVPSDQCSGACSSRYAASFESVRRELESRFGMPADRFRYVRGRVIVDVTGVAFFDFFHRQLDVAPNAIELHPVLAIHFE
ncbi:MAG TPA: hypothetical protein VNF02_05000 [Candidatus Limnocylindrales bacterium]|nr:hypothetical protein [Candidatus Limnocylindrales bacterium]